MSPSFARYVKSVDQNTIQAGIGTGVRFDTAQTTSPDITANTRKDQFTINKAGVWAVETAVRVTGVHAGADTWEALCTIGPSAGNTDVRYTAQNGFANAKTSTLCLALSVARAYDPGDTVAVNSFTMCLNGGTFSFTSFSEQVHISFVYIGPS